MKKLLRKRSMLLVALLVSLCMPAMAQKYYNFNAVALDVDGLPQVTNLSFSSAGIVINPNSPGSAGTKTISQYLTQKAWDIIGVTQDFNYHSDLISAWSVSKFYGATGNPAGTQGSNVVYDFISDAVDNDGVCLVYSSGYTVTEGNTGKWTTSDGENDNDRFVTKGYRQFVAQIAENILIDVYVLNLDEGSESADVTARTSQLSQFVNAILANTNNRPIIVMGTFNTLYTRENLKTNFIDAINNSGKGFTISDVWTELKRGGEYPTYGTEDELVNTGYYDSQRGEAYNKMFYINKSGNTLTIKPNTYERKVDMMQVDHMPILVNFTVTDPNGQASSNSGWTVDDGEISEPEIAVPAGNQVESGTAYYVKNVSTGLYLKSGARYATQATEGSAGMLITPEAQGSKYILKTLAGSASMSAYAEPYMDNGDNTTWTLEAVKDESGNPTTQYFLKISETQALSSTGEAYDVVRCTAFDATDDRQKWVFLTEEQIKDQMTGATPSNPYDVTPLIGAASFDRLDIDSKIAETSWPGLSFNSYVDWGNPTNTYAIAHYTKNEKATVSRILTGMPDGAYVVSFEGYYRARATVTWLNLGWVPELGNRQDFMWQIPVKMGTGSAYVMQNMNATFDDWEGAARTFRDNDEYLTTFSFSHSGGDLTLSVEIPQFTSGSTEQDVWLAFDNFVIKYLGQDADDGVKELVRNYINMTAQKVAQLNEAGQNAYDISEVIYRYENNLLSEDGSLEIAMIDAAYELALKAHNAYAAEQGSNGGDFTGLIVNPSFEDGNVGWDIQGWGIGAQPNANSAQQVDNDSRVGNYLLDAYHGNGTYSDVPATTQTITGLKNGLYLLQAKVTSFGPGDGGVPSNAQGNTVYLIGNNYHKGVIADTKTSFKEGELYFLVEDGTAKIGVVGGYNGYYYPVGGCFYKADDFRLKYVCDLANGRVKLALDEAKSVAATFDTHGQNTWESSSVYSTYETYISSSSTSAVPSVTSSDYGITEAKNVYDALTTAALMQKSVGSDMTWCLGDPSFELGKYKSVWTTTSGWETSVVMQNDADFAAVGAQGNYLFNTWNDNADADNSGVNSAITKTIQGLPNGTYRLTAMVTSDAGNTIFLMGNDARNSVVTEHTLGTPIPTESPGTMSITPSAKEVTTTDVNGSIKYSTSSTYTTSRLELGENGSLEITPIANPGETLVITSVVITYRAATGNWIKTYYNGNSVSATVDDGTSSAPTLDETNRTYTIDGLNAAKVILKNGSGNRALHITGIEVGYKRTYLRDNILLEAKKKMHEVSVDFKVSDGKATVGVVGGRDGVYNANGGCWYKVDDFHLQLLFLNETLEDDADRILYLSENSSYLPEIDFSTSGNSTSRTAYDNVYNYEQVVVQRTISSGKWSTLVLPFDLPIEKFGDGNWDVRELSDIENDTEATAVLKFVTPTEKTIKAGKCYIVRHTSKNLNEIAVNVDDVTFNTTTFDNSYTDNTAQGISFIGTYTSGYMPIGAYFITNNQFKKVVKANTNKIKGFRAYFVVEAKSNEVRSLSFRIGESTDIESANNEEPTVVGIYNLNGVRLDDMQEGVNILRMSDGTSVKVLIK